MINRALRRFLCNDSGNIAAMFSLALVPAVGLIGMGVDYTTGAAIKAKLDSIADSASLAAVTPAMLSQTDEGWRHRRPLAQPDGHEPSGLIGGARKNLIAEKERLQDQPEPQPLFRAHLLSAELRGRRKVAATGDVASKDAYPWRRRSQASAWATMVARSSNCGRQPSVCRMRSDFATIWAGSPGRLPA
jgi:hypothetical protein